MPLASRLIIQREQHAYDTLSRLLLFETAFKRFSESLEVVRRMDFLMGYRDEAIEYPDRQNVQKLLLETLREAEVVYLNMKSARKGLFKFDLEKNTALEFTAGEAKFEEKVDWDGYVKALVMHTKVVDRHFCRG